MLQWGEPPNALLTAIARVFYLTYIFQIVIKRIINLSLIQLTDVFPDAMKL